MVNYVFVAAGHRQGQVVFLAAVGGGEFGEQLLILPAAPDIVETLPPVRRGHHFFITLQRFLRLREVRRKNVLALPPAFHRFPHGRS